MEKVTKKKNMRHALTIANYHHMLQFTDFVLYFHKNELNWRHLIFFLKKRDYNIDIIVASGVIGKASAFRFYFMHLMSEIFKWTPFC